MKVMDDDFFVGFAFFCLSDFRLFPTTLCHALCVVSQIVQSYASPQCL